MKMDSKETTHEHQGMDHMNMSDQHSMNDDHGNGGHMMHMGDMKKKFWISLILMIPILLFSPMMGIQLPFMVTFPGSEWIVLIAATVIFFYGGMPFFTGAWSELKARKPAMMTLITLGTGVAYIYSLYAFVVNNFGSHSMHVMDFFSEEATLIVIMLLGHWLEMNAIMNAGNALEKMAQLLPGEAHVKSENGDVIDKPLAEVQVGETVIVRGGESIPTDGKIIAGQSSVNESLVTGEAKAIKKVAGEKVIGGSINGDGALTIEVTGTGESGYLAQVMQLVQKAQQDKSKTETLADRVAGWLFYAALGFGILAFVFWWINADLATALSRMVTVLVIACPHALGVAIPLVVARSTSIAAANGLLIQQRDAIEKAKHISHVLLDKTGTLTEGEFTLNTVKSLTDTLSDDEALSLIAGMEQHSSHPIATGILTGAKERKVKISAAENVETIKGVGLSGDIEGKSYQIVTAAFLNKQNIEFDKDQYDQLAQQGNSVSYLVSNDQALAILAVGDQIKPEAKKFITDLKSMGITPVMLTGDNQQTAQKVANSLGITEFKGQLLPEDKEKVVREYQAKGNDVMMVGDGVNDAPALVRANIGVAIGAGTDVAIDSADVVLVHSDPADVVNFLKLSKATNRKMIENLWWGAGYNVITIPLAAGILAPLGFVLNPAVGAAVMSLSTIIVALNAMTLRLKK
ncbi:heavy metal translocating P-type ATPase [Lapidilactobacillus mulanensis]|uniref:P-type Cu(+) transporter n=1 Tax=Lapidilactobacillus mulanensis TaxID=2485999 RepID=A0ABW4DMZ9_9LACO|nr:heavy metal translocating P-type ATPase [Lapidilactobacillus mulanensis]